MSRISQSERVAVKQRVSDLYHHAEGYFSRAFATPEVTFRRSGRNAGTAFLNQNRINLNSALFMENRAAFFSEVIPHEISHLLVWQLYGRVKPHGKEWQHMMEQVFNTPASATHSFDLSPLNLKTFRYRCGCDVIDLSIRRHNKILKGQRYLCKRCNNYLTAE
ncbi:SprT family zinc-dependent metalloprotease [Alteromonas sp. H39]|uniref:SprT family zinc-dependent metalloprotease n=1 Tax=Alteromonas sp. H39 TaxID=3389876 RepID=UPI0039E1B2E4